MDYKHINVIDHGLFILPKGDFRGGGAVITENNTTFLDARVIVKGKEKFYKLLLNITINKIKYDFSGEAIKYVYESDAFSTVKLYKKNNWVIRLDSMINTVDYFVVKDGIKFKVNLPKIKAGYEITIGRLSPEIEIITFSTLMAPKQSFIERAKVAYILIKI